MTNFNKKIVFGCIPGIANLVSLPDLIGQSIRYFFWIVRLNRTMTPTQRGYKYRNTSMVLLVFALFIFYPASVYSDVGFGAGFSPYGSSYYRKKKKPKPADDYIMAISSYFNQDVKDLKKLWNAGYGRNELIKLNLISQKSNNKLKDIIELRKKGLMLKRLSEKYKLDYLDILAEAKDIRKKIDFEVLRSSTTNNYINNVSTTSIEGE